MNTSQATSFERRTGRIGDVLVVAGGDDAQPVAFDRDLRRAEHVPGRMERDAHAVQRHRLAQPDSLRRAGEILAVAQPHHVERFLRRQHRAVAGAGVIGMAVRDHGALDRPGRIDEKAAARAEQAGRRRRQQVLGTHGAEICHIGAGNRSSMAEQPLFVSSGDLVADRRYRWALDYLSRGDADAAAEVLVQVVETAPGFATAWFALGAIRERLGDRDGAIAAFSAARDADREDYHGARLHLARLGVGEATPAMTAVYVRRLFDQHAPGVRPRAARAARLSRAANPSGGGGKSRRPAAAARLRARSRLRHRPGRYGLPAVLRPAHRRRSVARHDRAGARQGPLRPADRRRPL